MSRRLRLVLCWLVLGLSVVNLAWDVAHMDGWRDHGLFYYAPRLFRTGQNAYDWDLMKAQWRADGKPLGVDPGTTMSGFVNPPGMALLTLPPSLMPPRIAYRSLDAWNLLALGVCLLFLMKTAAPAWPLEARLLFVAYACWLPSVRSVVLLGQSTLLIGACLAAALYALSRRRDLEGGALIGLALAKFTLSLPFFALLLYRRNVKAAGAAVVTFVVINLALSVPFGVRNTLRAYRAVVAREDRPGTSYDALTTDPRWMPDTLVQTKRLFVLLIGHRRVPVDAANLLFSAAVVAALAYVLRPRSQTERGAFQPLEVAALMLASLLLFYHRTYDLAALLFVVYGLADYGFRNPSGRTQAWKLAFGLTLLVSYIVPSGLEALFAAGGGPTARCFVTCLLLVVIFGLILWEQGRTRDAEDFREPGKHFGNPEPARPV